MCQECLEEGDVPIAVTAQAWVELLVLRSQVPP